MRTSDRVFLEIPIIISGTNPAGRQFVENTRALVLSRRGARIISRQALVPQQNPHDPMFEDGPGHGCTGGRPDHGKRGGLPLWGCLPAPGSKHLGHQISACWTARRTRRAGCFLSAQTATLRRLYTWTFLNWKFFSRMRASRVPARSATRPLCGCGPRRNMNRFRSARAAPDTRHTIQERKSPRINLKVVVCIRHSVYGQEILFTANVSRGGFRIKSHKEYPIGTVIEAALPYTPGAANIFTPARIVHKELGVGAKTFVYGVAYIPSPAARSLTGLRITQLK